MKTNRRITAVIYDEFAEPGPFCPKPGRKHMADTKKSERQRAARIKMRKNRRK